MRAYGSRGHWDLEEGGVPTRLGSLDSKTRREMRRIFHKRARLDAKKEVKRQLDEQT